MHARPPYNDLRSNLNKHYREEWCATKFCEALGLINPEILAPPKQNDSVDQIIKFSTQRSLKLQIIEVAPKSPRSSELETHIQQGREYTLLKKYTHSMIKGAIDQKIKKRYSDVAKIHLLIYLNGPCNTLIDPDLDIDLTELQNEYAHASFQGISVIMSKASECDKVSNPSYVHIPIKHNPLLQNFITPSVTAQPLP